MRLENILWLTDCSAESTYALAYAQMLAEVHKTKLILMHVIENPTNSMYGRVTGDYIAREENARKTSRRWLTDLVSHELQTLTVCEVVIGEGEILEKIIEAVKTFHVGTIVMATHGHTGLMHLALGSVAEKVIRSVDCPVYVIRHPNRRSQKITE